MAQHLQNRIAREGFVFPAQPDSDAFRLRPRVCRQTPLRFPTRYFTSSWKRPCNVSRVPSLRGSPASTASAPRWRTPSTNSPPRAATAPVSRNVSPMRPSATPSSPSTRKWIANSHAAASRCAHAVWNIAAARIAAHGLNGIDTIYMDGFHALPDPELRVIARDGPARRSHAHARRRRSHARSAHATRRHGLHAKNANLPAAPVPRSRW